MKKSLAFAVSAVALVAAAPVIAHEQHSCIDDACTIMSIFDQAPAGGGSLVATTDTGGTPLHYGTWGFDTAGMDRAVKPGDDWFAFVNGTWAKNTTIRPDRTSEGAFINLRDLSEVRVHKLLDDYSINDKAHPDRMKAAIFYQGYMDQPTIEKLDAAPLKARLAPIADATSKEQIAQIMGRSVTGSFGGSFFGPGIGDDAKNPDVYALSLRQGGLGLGDRDLYLDPKFKPQVERYQAYVAQMLGLAGWPNPEAAAAAVVGLETKLAEAHWSRAQNRDRDKTYNPMSLADLQAQAPGFPWAAFWQAADLGDGKRVIVAQNTAMPKIAQVFADTDLDTLKAWEAFRMTDEMAPLLSKRFDDANFEFHGHFLNGQPQQRERWKRAVGVAEGAVGEGIGRDYVSLYFPPDSKAKMEQLVGNLRTALAGRIQNLTWMGADTKKQALDKLAHFTVKVGYPTKWRDYSALQPVPGDLVGNAERTRHYEWNYRRVRLGGPVDKTEWGMTPQTVNAYYNSTRNEIVFPAAILQPPFFDPKADMAVNYGGIGGVIGHEISHGFDDQGRKSDGNGVLRDWWTADDATKFQAQADRLGAEYEAYDFADLANMHINGKATMGENIGDLGGISIALDAYHASLNGRPSPVIDGFTGDQRVFLGWGQVWRTLQRPQALRQQLVSDPHSPGQIRAVAPLRNVDAWYKAWNIQPGDKLYIPPEQRVRIW
ncbi:MAG TPA: M13-type metalloendopeptidase [Allosphingosinicella sp.]|nr:M13-type metalloendopeptidase [Allosphingosinicella sp.]